MTDRNSAREVVPSLGATLGLQAGMSVLVVRAPDRDGVLMCNDAVLIPLPPPPCSTAPENSGTILAGERFTDPESGLEIVCTRAGHGVLTFEGKSMTRLVASRHRVARRNFPEDGAA